MFSLKVQRFFDLDSQNFRGKSCLCGICVLAVKWPKNKNSFGIISPREGRRDLRLMK
jgi:hypothetical protein